MARNRGYKGMKNPYNTQTKTHNRGCSIGDKCHGASSIFFYAEKTITIFKSITNSLTVGKLCHTIFRPTALPVGVFLLMPSSGGISPLTCTIFDPIIFLRNSVSIFVHISPTRLKYSIMGNYLDLGFKMAHRGKTGSHRGKRKLSCVLKE